MFLGSAQAQSVNNGVTTVLSTADSQNANVLSAQMIQLKTAETIQSLSFYVTTTGGNLILGIYDATGPSGGPGALKTSTASFAPTKGWNTAKVATPVSLAAGDYWMAFLPSSNTLGFVTTRGLDYCRYYSYAFGALPSKFSTSPVNCSPTAWSFYATLTTASTSASAVSGACGSSNGASLTTTPTANLCTAGTASAVSGAGPWSWSCAGSNGGATATCSATKTASASPVNGACGSSNGASVSTAPTANLCTAGTASAVSGSGPWSWTCAGSNGGSTASCSDKVASSGSDPAAGLLLPDRDATANWKMAGLLSVGGIPNRTTICKTLSPLGGGKDDTANIQNAIAACPNGQVVQLTAGAFTIAEGNYVLINKAISVRGAGAGSTILQRTNGAHMQPGQAVGSDSSPMVVLGPARWGPWFGNPDQSTNSTKLTADGSAGANTITVASTAGFSVGQIVLLDEVSGAGWQPDPTGSATSVWASSDYRVTYKKHNPSFSFDDFSATQYPYQAGTNGDQYSRLDRVTNEIKEIASISGNTVTFTSPLTISYRVSHTAQLTWLSDSGSGAPVPYVENAGLENLSTQNGDNGNIDFNWCAYCWGKNVESSIWSGLGIRFWNAFRCELREFYSHDAAYSSPGGSAYAIVIDGASSEILIEDGISVRTNKVVVARASGAGSVVGYNYMDMGFINYDESWIEIGLNASHFSGSHHVLFEGNYGFNADGDNTHGSSVYMTYFRNWLSGIRHSFVNPETGDTVNDASQPGNGPKRTVGPMSYSYWQTFIGNVLGIAGQMTGWIYQGDLTGYPAVWAPGWGDVDASGVWHVDPQMTNSAFPGHIIRDGNWDWATSSQKWDDTPVTIPNSLYRTSTPAFFGSNPWPWVNPTSGAVSTLPAKARFDNGTPNAAN